MQEREKIELLRGDRRPREQQQDGEGNRARRLPAPPHRAHLGRTGMGGGQQLVRVDAEVGHEQVKRLSDHGILAGHHASTSSSSAARSVLCAWFRVAETVPRRTPRAAAIAA